MGTHGPPSPSLSLRSYAFNLWSFVLSLFGISWVMPKPVVELLAGWHGGIERHRLASIWGVIPRCIMWNIWREGITKLLKWMSVLPLS